jgi:hypothetical protein
MKSDSTHADRSTSAAQPRLPESSSQYSPPRIERLGDLRDLTFGPSPGTGDSGGDPGSRKNIGT